VTVKKWYKMNQNVQEGRWSAQRVGEDAWIVELEGREGMVLWLPVSKFQAMFTESEMDVEMTVGELEGERAVVRESQEELRNGEYT
jgi:hypothetical protein